jgi:hypothetical protein
MSVHAAGGPEPFEVIHLGGEAAAIVPVGELRRLRAVEAQAPADVLETAEADAALAAHDEWVAAGRPGARPHDDVMAELLSGR